jgi:hypothetical protein
MGGSLAKIIVELYLQRRSQVEIVARLRTGKRIASQCIRFVDLAD